MPTKLKTVYTVFIIGDLVLVLINLLTNLIGLGWVVWGLLVIIFLVSYTMIWIFNLIYKVKPYRGKYYDRLLALLNENQLKSIDIYVMKSEMVNARAIGLWDKKGIVINSFLLDKFPFNELKAVFMHEVGHHKNFGIYILTLAVWIIIVLGALVSQWIGGLGFNLLVSSFISVLLLLPVVFKISRVMEHQADIYAKNNLENPEDFGNFLERMVEVYSKRGVKIFKRVGFLEQIFRTHDEVYDRIRCFQSSK